MRSIYHSNTTELLRNKAKHPPCHSFFQAIESLRAETTSNEARPAAVNQCHTSGGKAVTILALLYKEAIHFVNNCNCCGENGRLQLMLTKCGTLAQRQQGLGVWHVA
ncbi:hypothetical protein E2C01_021783 [Portunus trituberculatus]|uniref:Uncharacterized protein n=1 Tax=Portunus trituberculatus TaxID=210409 RepID=A0A5B7E742_PORTR|nr:hypothetical protein [Portunus trituberculatus]